MAEFTLNCSHCGSPFTGNGDHVYRFQRGRRVFCKPECRKADGARLVKEPLIDRFLRYVDKNGPVPARRPDLGPCWIWTGGKRNATSGRGAFMANGRCWFSHRFAYEYFREPIAVGLEPDHLCETPLCCNPWHLEAVTHRENTLRGESPSGKNSRKTHCKRDHPFSEENTRVDKYGHRTCRKCHAESTLADYHRRKLSVFGA